jgi:hypothetical protein
MFAFPCGSVRNLSLGSTSRVLIPIRQKDLAQLAQCLFRDILQIRICPRIEKETVPQSVQIFSFEIKIV